MKQESGFSLIELLIVATLLLIILGGVYFMILQYGEISETEYSRIKLQQESRFMLSTFADEIKSAGSVLTLANSGAFLSTLPYFNGIFPLNNTSFADGIIIATGDPDVVTTLSQNFDPSTGGTIYVEKTQDAYGTTLWSAGDKGIIIGPSVDPSDDTKTIGYYVFEVSGIDTVNNAISMRSNPVYYSGLLNTSNYTDSNGSATMNQKGNNVLYPIKAPVIKLTNFSIYLIKQVFSSNLNRNIRQLIRVIDADNQADVLSITDSTKVSVISENIWDMQISYTAYPAFPDPTSTNVYFAGGSSLTSLPDLLEDIRGKFLKELTITFVVLTDEYGGTGERTLTVPVIADQSSSYNLPAGKFNYKVLSFLIEPRNFNIVI